MQTTHERIVISVGGSLIVPDQIDTAFLSQFRDLILRKVSEGFSFSIIAGGGKTARRYQEAARQVRGDLPRDDLDWLGIHSTRLNGHLLRALFKEQAHHAVVKDPEHARGIKDPVIIAAGWQPGCSTDYDAVLMAKTAGAKKLVNLSNTDYIYAEDPKKNPNAQKFDRISWADFRKIIPAEWDPGLSSPFDPIAAREAEALGLEVACINGGKLEEFEKYLSSGPFVGSFIF